MKRVVSFVIAALAFCVVCLGGSQAVALDVELPLVAAAAPENSVTEFADEPDAVHEETSDLSEILLPDFEETVQQSESIVNAQQDAAQELQLLVSYDKDISCGVPVAFTAQASGGSGQYSYMLGCWYVAVDGGRDYVTDPFKYQYSAENTTSFTFYASGTYYLYAYVLDKGTTPLQTKRTVVTVEVQDPDYPTIDEVADRVAAECIEAGCASDYEKALWLHDWVINNMDYDYKNMLYCGVEGALARGLGICEAYHRGYCLLLKKVGIETGRMVGNGHVWTAVKLDGDWYQVDPTWDDPGYADYRVDLEHLYFCLNDELMAQVHSDHEPNEGYESNSLELNYFVQNGQADLWADDFVGQIQENLAQRVSAFEVETPSNPYGKIMYALAAYQLSKRDWQVNGIEVDLQVRYGNGNLTCVAAYAEPEIVLGDIDGDGTVSIRDQVLVHRHVAGTCQLESVQLRYADMNADGVVDHEDLELLAQKVLEQ